MNAQTEKPVLHTSTPWRWTRVDGDYDATPEEKAADKCKSGWVERPEKGSFEALWSGSADRPVMVAQDASSYRADCDFPNEKDGEFLLRAVNKHEKLLETLINIRNETEAPDCSVKEIHKLADEAIAQAESK